MTKLQSPLSSGDLSLRISISSHNKISSINTLHQPNRRKNSDFLWIRTCLLHHSKIHSAQIFLHLRISRLWMTLHLLVFPQTQNFLHLHFLEDQMLLWTVSTANNNTAWSARILRGIKRNSDSRMLTLILLSSSMLLKEAGDQLNHRRPRMRVLVTLGLTLSTLLPVWIKTMDFLRILLPPCRITPPPPLHVRISFPPRDQNSLKHRIRYWNPVNY